MHCHLDMHITWGLFMVFVVNDGLDALLSLYPPHYRTGRVISNIYKLNQPFWRSPQ